MINSAADFLGFAALRRTTVDIHGASVTVRELSVAERFEFSQVVAKDRAAAEVFLVRCCLIDQAGQQLFSAEADVAELAKSRPDIIDAVATAVLDISGLRGDEKKD